MKSPKIVHEGRDGWIYLIGGTNGVLDQYTNLDCIGKERIAAWIDLLKNRKQRFSKNNIKYVHFIAPEKLSIYPEFFDLGTNTALVSPISQLLAGIDASEHQLLLRDFLINPLPYFLRQKQHFQLYWKTDSHWKFEGCFCAYQLICHRLGVKPLKDLHHRPFGEGFLTFDLGSKIDPPIKEKGRFYKLLKHSKRVYANKIVQFKEENDLDNEGRLHVGSIVVFKNETDYRDPAKVIIFGDSFSEYRPTLLTGMLAETFREVHFVWSTSVDFDYVERNSPDIVISEISERFMMSVPTDEFDSDTYCVDRLENYK